MGQIVSAAFGPMAVPGAGNHTFIYSHPADGKPSRIGLIAANISAGTQTGKVTFSYGNDVSTALEIEKGVFTAAQPSYGFEPGIVIQPGQVILIHMYDITAGDTIRAYVEGH